MTAGSAKPKEYRVAGISMPGGYRLRGFTLIEMMIVVAIVAVLAAIAVPSFSDFMAKSRVKEASRAIHTFLSQAKSEGVIRDQDIYVSIQGGANWCLGFIPDPDGATTCDCSDSPAATCVAPVSGTNVTQVISSADFPNVTVTSNFGGSTSFDRLRGMASNGTVEVVSNGWGVQTIVSIVGRVRTCAPTGQAYKGVTGFEDC